MKIVPNIIKTGTLSAIVGLTSLVATSASAESMSFTVRISGIKAGNLRLSSNIGGGNYNATGNVKSSGMVGKLVNVYYNGTVNGTYSGSKFKPSRYKGRTGTGDRKSNVSIKYSGGNPSNAAFTPSRPLRPYEVSARNAKGAVDPLTVTAMMLRTVSKSELCNKSVNVYDGARKSRVSIGKPIIKGDKASCNGTYSRVAGLKPKAMAKRKNFPFTLNYTKQANGNYRVTSFTTQTTFGTASATRN